MKCHNNTALEHGDEYGYCISQVTLNLHHSEIVTAEALINDNKVYRLMTIVMPKFCKQLTSGR